MIRLPWRKSGAARDGARGNGVRGADDRAHPAKRAATNSGEIRGERGMTVASRAHSLQSRLNTMLAVALTIGIAVAMLVWYYGEVLGQRHVRAAAGAAQRVEHMRPPSLGPIVAPRSFVGLEAESQPSMGNSASEARKVLARPLTVSPERGFGFLSRTEHMSRVGANARSRPDVLARRLSGLVFDAPRAASAPSRLAARQSGYPRASVVASGVNREAQSPDPLRTLLSPDRLRATRARLLPQRRLLLPMGDSIDCTLETAIDSTLPGLTTCITATDTFSADGTVVLLGRGTKLIGQTRGQVRQGAARVFVIWTQARTPRGVVVRLDSPGTDALGRSGLTGRIDRHFWQRFGAALLVSTIDGAVQSSSRSSAGTVIVDPAASEGVMTQVLSGTVDIPPTVRVPSGARIEVLVARDIDFRSVYALVPR